MPIEISQHMDNCQFAHRTEAPALFNQVYAEMLAPTSGEQLIACGGYSLGKGPENPVGSFTDNLTPEDRAQIDSKLSNLDDRLFENIFVLDGPAAISGFVSNQLAENFQTPVERRGMQVSYGQPLIDVTLPPQDVDGNPAIKVETSQYDGPEIKVLARKSEDGSLLYVDLSSIGGYLSRRVPGLTRGSCNGLSPVSRR